MTTDTRMQTQLESVLRRELPGIQGIVSCQQLTAGASQETYRVQLRTADGALDIALRRCPPTLAGQSVPGQVSPSTEAQLLQLACDAGIPVPEPIYCLKPEDNLGEGYLMQWLEGETLGQRIVRSEALANVRPALARQCGEALGRIHSVNLDSQLASLLPSVSPEALVRDTWDIYKTLETAQPMVDFSARWLLQNLPASSRRTLVHGDFRNGNLMIDSDGIRAVLDWELAHIGDPVRDLGWLCVNSWRFGRPDLPVGGFGRIEDLLAGYRATSGVEVGRETLTFWMVFGSFWWSVTTLAMAASWRTGETPSLERPVIGRRSSEGQMDCINLIIPGPFTRRADNNMAEGAQLPMAAELVESVRVFLKQELAGHVEGRASFLAKVAANSLGIAQRELLYGPQLALDEHARLQALMGEGDLDSLRWQLVNALRADFPLDSPGLQAHLRATVAGQLSIDQPHYSALHAAG